TGASGGGSSAAPSRGGPRSVPASGPAPSTGTSSYGRPPWTDGCRSDRNTSGSGRPPERHDEDRVLAGRVRREELDHGGVVEGEPRGAEALRVGGEVGAPAGAPGLEVGEPIAAVAERGEDRGERREEVDHRRRVASKRLLEAEIRRLVPVRARLQELERVLRRTVAVRARLDPVHRVDDQIEVHEPRGDIGVEGAGRGPERRRQLHRRQQPVTQLPRRSAALDRRGEPTAGGRGGGRQGDKGPGGGGRGGSEWGTERTPLPPPPEPL